MKQPKQIGRTAALGLMLVLPLPASAQTATAVPPDSWAWRATVYGWLPSVKTSTQFSVPTGGSISAEADASDVLSKLKLALMGTLEARRGPWSFVGDAIYLNLGDLKSRTTSISGPSGIVTVPIDAGTRSELSGGALTLEGGYALLQTPNARADFMVGARYMRLTTKLDWHLNAPTAGLARDGGVEATKDLFDGVVGLRGTAELGGNWDFRYYADVGAGSSRLTWQAVAGVGYRYRWGDVTLAYRYLAYDFHNDRPISNMRLSGPAIAVGFKF